MPPDPGGKAQAAALHLPVGIGYMHVEMQHPTTLASSIC